MPESQDFRPLAGARKSAETQTGLKCHPLFLANDTNERSKSKIVVYW